MRRGSRFGGAALLASCLAACQSAPTRLYTLYPVAASVQGTTAEGSTPYAWPALRIDAVHLPAVLDRAQVVSDVSPGELKVHELEQWSAPLGEVAKEALSADLASRLPAGKLVSPHLPKPAGALGVTVDILDFHTDARGAYLEASWGVVGSHIDPGAHQRSASLRIASGRATTTANATARTLSLLLGQLADRIVADLAASNPS